MISWMRAAFSGITRLTVLRKRARKWWKRKSAGRLARFGYNNAHVHCGDGTLGLPEFASYDAILVAAAAPSVPAPLLAQLAEGGRMVVPVGDVENQDLRLIERSHDTFRTILLEPGRFVPLLGAPGWKESPQQ